MDKLELKGEGPMMKPVKFWVGVLLLSCFGISNQGWAAAVAPSPPAAVPNCCTGNGSFVVGTYYTLPAPYNTMTWGFYANCAFHNGVAVLGGTPQTYDLTGGYRSSVATGGIWVQSSLNAVVNQCASPNGGSNGGGSTGNGSTTIGNPNPGGSLGGGSTGGGSTGGGNGIGSTTIGNLHSGGTILKINACPSQMTFMTSPPVGFHNSSDGIQSATGTIKGVLSSAQAPGAACPCQCDYKTVSGVFLGSYCSNSGCPKGANNTSVPGIGFVQ